MVVVESLDGVGKTTLLGALNDAIDETTSVAVETRQTLESHQTASLQVSAAADRLSGAIQKASESAHSREARMTQALQRTHRWTVSAVCATGAVSTLALIGLGLVLLR